VTGPRAPRANPAYDHLPRAQRLRATTGPDFVGGYPKLVAEWHPFKNGELFPYQVARGSIRKVWWRCSRDRLHEWEGRVAKRVEGYGCPICSGRQTLPLAVTHPELAAEWHPTKNGELTPSDLMAGSHRKVWWRCPNGPDHEWLRAVKFRTDGGPCPFCTKRATSVTNAITSSPELAAQWHPTKNRGLQPEIVRLVSTKSVWWRCTKDPTHEWRTSPRKRALHGCPHCAWSRPRSHRADSDSNSLASNFPLLAAEWHPTRNGAARPETTVPSEQGRVWWRCSTNPKHEWQAGVRGRVRGISGDCPECRVERASLAVLHPELAAELHPTRNGSKTALTVRSWERTVCWWRCSKGHVWSASAEARVRGGGRCPKCHP